MSVVKSEWSDILSLGYKALFCFMQKSANRSVWGHAWCVARLLCSTVAM